MDLKNRELDEYLIRGVLEGNLIQVEEALKAGANPNAVPRRGCRCLVRIAKKNGDFDIVVALRRAKGEKIIVISRDEVRKALEFPNLSQLVGREIH